MALDVGAIGTLPLCYQWRFNGNSLDGATNLEFVIANVQGTNVGGYAVVVTNGYGAVTSVVANLTIEVPPPVELRIPMPSVRPTPGGMSGSSSTM